jgi:hypothetical protein
MRRLFVLLVIVLAVAPTGAQLPAAAATAPGLEGRVTADGSAVAGATIDAIRSGTVVGSATTTGTGTFDLDLPETGTYDVRVLPPSGASLTGTVAAGVVVDSSAVTVLDIQLRSPLGALDLTVVDGSNAPIDGARVSLRGAGFTVSSALTDSAGTARLVTRPGSYGLRIEAPSPPSTGSLLPATMVVETAPDAVAVSVAGETRTVRIPTTTLTVTTTRQADGAPVAGVAVTASARDAVVDLGGGLAGTARFTTATVASDSAGNVVHTVIPASDVSVSSDPTSSDRFLIAAAATTDVAPTGAAVVVPLPPAPVQPVTVRLLDAAGQPVEGATVRSTLESAATDVAGDATVLARSDVPTELQVTRFSSDPAMPEVVTFRRSIQPAAPLGLVARARVGTVAVTVTRDGTTPVSGAKVALSSSAITDGDGWIVRSPVGSKLTDGSGLAAFRVYPAQYSVTASSANLLTSVTDAVVGTGASNLTVDLDAVGPSSTAPGVRVTGRVITTGGFPIASLEVRSASTGSRLATTGTDGGFAFDAPVGPDPQSLRLQSTTLLRPPNGFDAPLPAALQVVIPDVFTASGPDPIQLGDIVLPIDSLDVRVVDQVGVGINGIRIGAESLGSRFPVTVGGSVIQARGTSEYPTTLDSPIVLNGLLGDVTLHLLPGTYEIQLVEDYNFSGVTLPISAFAAVDPVTDDILQVSVTRPNAALLTTLDGAPKVGDDPLVLEGPRPRLIPIVSRPDGFQDGTTSAQGELLDWVLCETDDGISDVAVLRESCPGDNTQIRVNFDYDEQECPELNCDRLPDFPSYPVTVRVAFRAGISDGAGLFLNEGWRVHEVTILPPVDRPPSFAAVGEREAGGPEGSIVMFGAAATDDEPGVEVSWDLDADGIGDVAGETLLFDLPDGPGEGAIRAIATDSSGQSTSRELYWGSSNVAPNGVLQVTGPDAGGTVQIAVVDITDPSADDLAAGIDVSLDLDNNGSFETPGTTGSIDTTGLPDGTYPVRARLADRDRGERILTGSFLIGGPQPNAAPTVDPGGPYTVGEGGTITLDASTTDPDGDPVTVTWDLPGQGTGLADPVTFDAADVDGPSTVDVTVTACDTPASGQPECTTETVTVGVTNVAPSLATGDVSGAAGTEVTLPITVTDPAPADVLTVRVDWGDGTTPEEITPFAGAPVAHTYATEGAYTVTVIVSDDDGGTSRETSGATITAVPPPPPPPVVDLRLTVEGGEGLRSPGDRFDYRSTVRNASTDVDAQGVVVTIVLDPRLGLAAPATLIESLVAPTQPLTQPWSCSGSATIKCSLAGPLAAGSEVALELPVVIDDAAAGALTTTFSVSADTELSSSPFVERVVTVAEAVPPVTVTPAVPVAPAAPTIPDPVAPAATPSTPITTTLPETGTDAGSWLAAAFGLVLIGWIGVRIAQRPRRSA